MQPLEPARRRNGLPHFRTEVDRRDGFDHIINLVPTRLAGSEVTQERIRRLIWESIRNRAVESARRNGWTGTRESILQRLHGVVQISSRTGPTRYHRTRYNSLVNFTEEEFEDIFAELTHSDETLTIMDVDWALVLDLNQFRAGGAHQVTKPGWLKIRRDLSWNSYSDEYGQLSCAAVSLTLSMNGWNTSRPKQYMSRPQQLIKDARELQESMEWGEYVTFAELEKFVEKFPKFRLTILMSENNASDYTFTGKEFEPINQDRLSGTLPSPFYLYLYYDLKQKHFASIRAPLLFFKCLRNDNNMRFCHACPTAFNYRTGHSCEQYQIEAKKVLIKQCKKCGLSDCTKCHLIDCRNCGVFYPRDDPMGEQHRCMVLEEEKDETGYDTENTHDGKKPALWAYDLESRIETVFTDPVEINLTDDEGYYTDEVCFIEVCSKQVANFVYAVNVFTGENIQFSGDTCMDDFVSFMLNFNRGISILTRQQYLLRSQCRQLRHSITL